MTQPQLPPRTVLTCSADASHKIRTRQPPGSVLLCTACGLVGAARDDRHGARSVASRPAAAAGIARGPSHHQPPQDGARALVLLVLQSIGHASAGRAGTRLAGAAG